MMEYSEFLEDLKAAEWSVPNKSFAHKTYGDWQVAFIRMGGRYQLPGQVAFVVCIRHTSLRDLEEERPVIAKEPHSYPFKLTTHEIASKKLKYQSKLLNYEVSTLEMTDDWSGLFLSLNKTVPNALSAYSASQLRAEIMEFGEDGYVERLWVEDLA